MRITRRNMFNREANEFNTYDLNITEDQLKAYNDGELIQRAFPNLNADEREFIMTGCPIGSWDEIVGDPA